MYRWGVEEEKVGGLSHQAATFMYTWKQKVRDYREKTENGETLGMRLGRRRGRRKRELRGREETGRKEETERLFL